MSAAARPLTIGIDARAATEEVAGRGRVVRELLQAFAARAEPHRYRLYARSAWHEPLDERFAWELGPANVVSWHLWAGRAMSRDCDACLATNSYLTPMLVRRPTATIVYDLVALDPAMGAPRRSAIVERTGLREAVRRSAALLTISRATADALAARVPAAAGKTTVMPLGVSPALGAETAASADLPDGFV